MASPGLEALVVDASVAAKWHLTDEEYAQQALDVLERFARGELTLLAPEQIRYEVPSAITAATLGTSARLPIDLARLAIEMFLALGIETYGRDDLILAAYPLVHQHQIAFYDALYLALAQQLSLPLLLADRRLYQRIRGLPEVVWIGDYAAPKPR
jgi:predicted nucleic acid-binding protein